MEDIIMSVFNELKETRNFNDYVVMAQKEQDVEVAESKQIAMIVKSLVKKLINSDGFIDGGEKIDLFELCDYMAGAMIVGMAARDEIVADAKEFVKKYNNSIPEVEVIEEEN